MSVLIFVTRRHCRPSSSDLHAWLSAVSEDTQVHGSVACVLGTLAGRTGTSGMFGTLGMFELLMMVEFRQDRDVDEV